MNEIEHDDRQPWSIDLKTLEEIQLTEIRMRRLYRFNILGIKFQFMGRPIKMLKDNLW